MERLSQNGMVSYLRSHIHRSRRSSYGELSSEDMTNYLYLIDERKL